MAPGTLPVLLIFVAVLYSTHCFAATDLKGSYELFVKQGNCPSTIVHKNVLERDGVYAIPHNQIIQNGVECTGSNNFGIITWKMLEDADQSIAEAIRTDSDMAPLFSALEAQNSSPYVGLELKDRNCGASKISQYTFFVFVNEEKKIEIPGLITLFPGAKYMIAYDGNSPVPCTYFSKIANREIGAPLPSPAPSPALPAGVPPPVTGSVPEDGSGIDEDREAGFFAGAGASEEPQESAESDDGSTCFPSDASVTLPGGFTKRMDAIQLGDHVQVAPGLYSEVFMFTHRDTDTNANFVDITTASGAKLQLTPGHYMYVNSRLAAASTVREGDIVDLANGEASTVVGVHTVTKTGIYNPQTVHGDIVVNGIVASTYTRTVHPNAAHSLLAPFRALFRAFGMSTAVFDSGSETLAAVSPQGVSTF